jgi:hypothetical protein
MVQAQSDRPFDFRLLLKTDWLVPQRIVDRLAVDSIFLGQAPDLRCELANKPPDLSWICASKNRILVYCPKFSA